MTRGRGRADLHPALLQRPQRASECTAHRRAPVGPRLDLITVDNVGAVVVPASCVGGIPVLAAEMNSIPVIAVRENRTVLDVTNDHMHLNNVVTVETYLEAAGVLVSCRRGYRLEQPSSACRRCASGPGTKEPSVRCHRGTHGEDWTVGTRSVTAVTCPLVAVLEPSPRAGATVWA